ncbi:MAG: tetratricopeptide repeat protein [Magnetococcales bacterium]|nr:tetratricopeptide repeat protein [Magnetococcales bacterium]
MSHGESSLITRLTRAIRKAILRLFLGVARFCLHRLDRMQHANPTLDVRDQSHSLASFVQLLEGLTSPPVPTPTPVTTLDPPSAPTIERPVPHPPRRRSSPSDLLATGLARMQAGQPEEALHLITPHLSVSRPNMELLNLAALCHERLGRLEQAKTCWKKALRFQPHFAKASFNLGVACLNRGQYGEAITALRRTVQVRPDDVEAHLQLGRALQKQGQSAEAEASFRRALAIDPHHAEAHHNLGMANERKATKP